MAKKIFITAETSLTEEIKPLLENIFKGNPDLVNKTLETCKSVKSHLRDSAINSPDFSQHITRTVMYDNKTIIISGSNKKPSLFKRIFG